jgi:hypothetical protein
VEMARLAKDLERLRANNERIMQDKQRLTRELEDLGIDTEGMSHADMRATKNEIERARSPDYDPVSHVTETVIQTPLSANKPEIAAAVQVEPVHDMAATATPQRTLPPVSTQNVADYGYLPGLGPIAPVIPASASAEQRFHQKPPSERVDPQTQSGFAVSHGATVNASTVNDRASATPMDDDEDFYSPPPPAEVNHDLVEAAPGPPLEQGSADTPSPSEEGEVAMSLSSEEVEDEEEYEPDEPIVEEHSVVEKTPEVKETALEPQVQPPQLPVEQSQSIGQSQISTEDEEAYEPPDVDNLTYETAPLGDKDAVEQPPQNSHVVPQASSPGDNDDGAMDIATSSSDDSDNSESESNLDEELQSDLDMSGSQVDVTQEDLNIANDIAPELQPNLTAAVVPVAAQPNDVRLPSSRMILADKEGPRRRRRA